MNLTSAQLKFNARQLMDHRYPTGIAPVLTAALIYLLATRWVSLLVSLTTTDPIDTILDKLQAAAATGSPAAVNAAVAGLPKVFEPMSAKVGLFCSVLLLLYTLVVRYGYSDYAMQFYRGSRPTAGAFFQRFDLCGKIILLSLVIYLCTYLWSLLFIIPGLIAWYRYRMSRYVLLDHPDMGVFTAWGHSKKMMQGRKAQLFLLDLSFLIWIVVAYLAANVVIYLLEGVGAPTWLYYVLSEAVFTAFYVYLTPYMELSYVGFYHMVCPPDLLPVSPAPKGFDQMGE